MRSWRVAGVLILIGAEALLYGFSYPFFSLALEKRELANWLIGLNASLAGDPNSDGNIYNDRLPGYIRNAFLGPDYFSTDFRLTRSIRCGEHVVWNLVAESFNVFNRTNARVQISSDGYYNSAGQFVAYTTTVKGKLYPGEYLMNSQFLTPTNAYAPRQVQFSLRLSF